MTQKQRKWWILIGMICAFSMVFIDTSAVSITLPHIQRNLGTSSVTLQWIVNAYLLMLATFIILGGKIADMLGHRKIFLGGLVVFMLASISVALSPTGIWAVISRAIQGIGGAFMIPNISVIIYSQFEPSERGKALGIYVGSSAVFAAAGPIIGGLLTSYLSWRWVFWINLPLAIISFIMTVALVPVKLHEEHVEKKLDWLGFFLSTIGIVFLVSSLMEGSRLGWSSVWILSGFVIAIISLILFLILESRITYPLIEIGLFKQTQFSISVGILFMIQAAFATGIFWPMLLQNVLGYNASTTGLLLLPIMVPVIFMPTIAGKLYDRYGPRLPVSIGGAGVTVGLLWAGIATHHYNYWWLVPGFLLFGLSIPLVFGAVYPNVLRIVPVTARGLASGLCGASRQLGNAIGLAIAGALVSNLTQYRLSTFLATAPSSLEQTNPQALEGLLSGSPEAKQAVQGIAQPLLNELHVAAKHAFAFAFGTTLLSFALFGLIVSIVAWKLPIFKQKETR